MSMRAKRLGLTVTILGPVTAAAAAGLAAAGVEPFRTWLYQFAWYGTLAGAAGALAARDGRPPLTAGQASSLLLWSVPFWYLFEAANLRLANWYYVLLPAGLPTRWLGSATAFATVLPALYLAHRWTARAGLARGWRTAGFRVRDGHLAAVAGGGVLFVALALWRPSLFFPLIWGALTLLLEPWNYRRGPDGSLLGDLARGRPGRIVRLLAAGLVVGVAWESLNAAAGARWIYTVPGLEGMKLFEMPLPGYLGFPVLALDGFVVYRALANLGVAVPAWDEDDPGTTPEEAGRASGLRSGRTAAAVVAGLVLCVAAQAGMDRWTVDSFRASPGALPGVDAGEAVALRDAGYGNIPELARADSAAVARASGLPPGEAGAAVRAARLSELRGLGPENASVLWATGIRSVCDLAEAGRVEVAAAVRSRRSGPRTGHPPRVRVWLDAARRDCPCGC